MKVVTHDLIADDSAYDIIIIGAGPSGLASALALDCCTRSDHNLCKILLIEEGKDFDERDRWNSTEVTCGVGGSGLFSDGKFSFFPSSSQLWTLHNKNFLIQSYNCVSEFLQNASQTQLYSCTTNNNNVGKRDTFDIPSFPSDDEIAHLSSLETNVGEWTLKKYPSYYMDLQQRKKLISLLQDACTIVECVVGCKVGSVAEMESSKNKYKLTLESKNCHPKTIKTKYILFCGGRFGPLFLNSSLNIATSFKRLEVGVRIQQDTKDSFFVNTEPTSYAWKINDPKYKFMDATKQVEWRTFCACNDGEVVLSDTQGLWTVSGRADCSPSGKSNIGFNTRILDENAALQLWRELEKNLKDSNVLFKIPLKDFFVKNSAVYHSVQKTFGGTITEKIWEGFVRLQEKFPSLSYCETTLIGPTLEGVGLYPKLYSHSLRCQNKNNDGTNIWVAGDCCGVCRGIVAGMISGYYAALDLWQELSSIM